VLVARKLGMVEVPCIELAHLTPRQRRAYIIADNKLALASAYRSAGTICPPEVSQISPSGSANYPTAACRDPRRLDPPCRVREPGLFDGARDAGEPRGPRFT
jgi:hypothetical protein